MSIMLTEDIKAVKQPSTSASSIEKRESLEEWARNCHERATKHAELASACNFKHKLLSTPSILAVTTSSALSIYTIGGGENNVSETGELIAPVNPTAVQFVILICNILSGALTLIIELFGFMKLSASHTVAYRGFIKLEGEMNVFTFQRHSEEEWDDALTQYRKEFQNLINQAPVIERLPLQIP